MEGRVDAVLTEDVLFLLYKERLIWQNQIQVNRKDEETHERVKLLSQCLKEDCL
jgi:hypothetical protein